MFYIINVKLVLVRGPKIKERKCPGKIQIEFDLVFD